MRHKAKNDGNLELIRNVERPQQKC